MNPFGLVRQKIFPSYLGVDIGTASIKAVEVKQGKQLPQLVNYGVLQSQGYLARAGDILQSSNLKLSEREITDLLKKLIEEMNPGTKEAMASIPIFSVFMTVLDFPEMSQSELEKSLSYQVRQYIPLPLSEVALDWMKIGEKQDENGFKYQQVLLISVPQGLIKKYQNIFKAAGLNLRLLEIESLSLARSLVGTDPTSTIIVDIGSYSTSIAFVIKGQLMFTGHSDFAGSSITQALANSLNISPIRAEELKKENGIAGFGPSHELSTIMLPFVDGIINEIKKAQFNFSSQFPGVPKSERLILSGGGANLVGIERYVEKELELPTIKAAPLLKFEYPSEIEPLVGELNPVFSLPLGLVLKEFS